MPHLEATLDLVGRCGAAAFEIGYLHDDVPVEEAGWYAHVQYQGARIIVEDQPSPEAAADALAARLLRGAHLPLRSEGRSRRPAGDASSARLPVVPGRPSVDTGCDAPTLHVQGKAGDLAAIHRAIGHRP